MEALHDDLGRSSRVESAVLAAPQPPPATSRNLPQLHAPGSGLLYTQDGAFELPPLRCCAAAAQLLHCCCLCRCCLHRCRPPRSHSPTVPPACTTSVGAAA